MSEVELKKLDKDSLFELITCDPITTKGSIALQKLGLTNIITEEYFFENLYVDSKFQDDKEEIVCTSDIDLQHSYNESSEDFKIIKKMSNRFDGIFLSDIVNESPLLIIGTAGNGKSVEINHKIWKLKKENNIKCNHIYYNFERSQVELTHDETIYRLKKEQETEPLWLILMVILKSLYELVEKYYKQYKSTEKIKKNHQEYFIQYGSAGNDEKTFFSCINSYNPDDTSTHKELFDAMIKFIGEDVGQSIENLLKMTMNFMYCIDPDNKNYIIFDNLEHYITLNTRDVPIPNTTLIEIRRIADNITTTMVDLYDRIHNLESWRAFKIIIVIRRTSARLMGKPTEQFVAQVLRTGYDYTKHFNIWDIWKNKKDYLWNNVIAISKGLKNSYDADSTKIIEILDGMMDDIPGRRGTSYQERISDLMNSSLRRIGSSHAYTVMEIYKKLSKNSTYCINYDEYIKLYKDTESVTRYFYRHMLLELQYDRMANSDESKKSFNNLLLKESTKKNTIVRRILSYLSHYIDTTEVRDENDIIIKTKMFETLSLYELMKRIFINPAELNNANINVDNDVSKIVSNPNIVGNADPFMVLATALTALANMNNYIRKCAPFIILGVKDPRYDSPLPEEELADILKEIWQAGEMESRNNRKYNRIDYGIRLTEAGHMFLHDIQPSFSFIAALYSSNELPLFFLKDKNRIEIIIKSVYNVANTLCASYELAAHSFCGPEVSLFDREYLPYINGYITFRRRVKDMHINHLYLYRDFIEKKFSILGFTENEKIKLIKYIDCYINKYSYWRTNEKCF